VYENSRRPGQSLAQVEGGAICRVKGGEGLGGLDRIPPGENSPLSPVGMRDGSGRDQPWSPPPPSPPPYQTGLRNECVSQTGAGWRGGDALKDNNGRRLSFYERVGLRWEGGGI
jgi:hypothetical protein